MIIAEIFSRLAAWLTFLHPVGEAGRQPGAPALAHNTIFTCQAETSELCDDTRVWTVRDEKNGTKFETLTVLNSVNTDHIGMKLTCLS